MAANLLRQSLLAAAFFRLLIVAPSVCAQSNGVAKEPPKKVAPVLDEEARSAARLYWDSEFTRCGASYDTYEVPNEVASDPAAYLDAQGTLRWRKAPAMSQDHDNGVFRLGETRWVVFKTYKGTSFSVLLVTPKPLSPADRLNGIEWQGEVRAPTPSVNRSRHTIGSDNDLRWAVLAVMKTSITPDCVARNVAGAALFRDTRTSRNYAGHGLTLLGDKVADPGSGLTQTLFVFDQGEAD